MHKVLSLTKQWIELPRDEHLIINWTEHKTPQLPLVLTGDVRAGLDSNRARGRTAAYAWDQVLMLFLL